MVKKNKKKEIYNKVIDKSVPPKITLFRGRKYEYDSQYYNYYDAEDKYGELVEHGLYSIIARVKDRKGKEMSVVYWRAPKELIDKERVKEIKRKERVKEIKRKERKNKKNSDKKYII